jgi:hypothetical protein
MDASQYKDYILTLLFVKYVSDKAKADPNSLIDVPKGGSFDDMLAAKGDKEIGDRINKIIAALAAPGSAARSHLPPERVGVLGRASSRTIAPGTAAMTSQIRLSAGTARAHAAISFSQTV